MNFIKLRNWLMKSRTAIGFRCFTGDEYQDFVIDGQTWADMARTIIAMKPDKIQALDAQDRVMRAVECVNLIGAEVDEDPDIVTPTSTTAGRGIEFEVYARLLADAHKSGQGFMEKAFDKLVEIVNVQARSLAAVEKSLEQTGRLLAKAYAAGAGPTGEQDDPGFLQTMIQSFVNGAGGIDKVVSMFASDPPPTAPTNGKGTLES